MNAMKMFVWIAQAFEDATDGSQAKLDSEPSQAEHFIKCFEVCAVFRHDHKKTRQYDDDCRVDF